MAFDLKSFFITALKVYAVLLVYMLFAVVAVEKRADDVSLESLEALIQQQGATIQQQGAMIQQQGAVIQELQTRLSASEVKANTLTTELNTMNSKFNSTSRAVAFTVRFSNSPSNIGDQAVFKFDTIVTNLGQGYDSQTGIFTAPVSGLYFFFLKIMSANDQGQTRVAIDKHGQVLAFVWAAGQTDVDDQGSNLVTTHLNTGDQVWVRHEYGSTGIHGGVYTAFSGSLLQAD